MYEQKRNIRFKKPVYPYMFIFPIKKDSFKGKKFKVICLCNSDIQKASLMVEDQVVLFFSKCEDQSNCSYLGCLKICKSPSHYHTLRLWIPSYLESFHRIYCIVFVFDPRLFMSAWMRFELKSFSNGSIVYS